MVSKDPLEGQVVDRRYLLKHQIGSGGMSVVYLAEQLDSGKSYAIKLLRSAFATLPDFVQRFEQEAHACQRLSHPHCLQVTDFGFAFGSPFLVMELIQGRPLSALIATGPIPCEQSIVLTRQILDGLGHAHARGVVHRDLKPGNILIVETAGTSHVKIMDFGTAQLLNEEGAQKGSHPSTEIGTPWYMSPEQAAGQETDPRTDLYAVGIILFEMLTKARPYTAEDPMRVLAMHLSSPIPSPRALKPEVGISPELEAVMVKAMQKQPADRFPTAEEFAAALEHIPEVKRQQKARPLPPSAALAQTVPPPPATPSVETLPPRREETPQTPPSRGGRRNKIIVMVIAAGLTVGLGGWLFFLFAH
jgi:serine/threonine-protein kinase